MIINYLNFPAPTICVASPYVYVPYDSRYPLQFASMRVVLASLLPKAHIEHIGSTAVEGLGGKPIVDILVGVKDRSMASGVLVSAGFVIDATGGDEERVFFRREGGFHIHIVNFNSEAWRSPILFREMLRKNEELRLEYQRIKQEAIKSGLTGSDYRAAKHPFIERVINRVVSRQ